MTEPKLTHLSVLGYWCTPAQLKRITAWGSADQLLDLLETLGSPAEAKKMVADLKATSESAEWARELRKRGKIAAGAIITSAAVVVILQSGYLKAAEWFGW